MDTLPISAPPPPPSPQNPSFEHNSIGSVAGMKADRTEVDSSSLANKPKQSKSRNGCVTCKAKRLKCDETKPTCLQCHKRGVPCGGYKKDFKWRPFEESTIVGKGPKALRKGTGVQKRKSPSPPRSSPRVSGERLNAVISQIQSGRTHPTRYTSLTTPLSSDPFQLDQQPHSIPQILPPTTTLPMSANIMGCIEAGLYGDGLLNGIPNLQLGFIDPSSSVGMESMVAEEPLQELLDFAAKQYASEQEFQAFVPGTAVEAVEDDDDIEEIIRENTSENNFVSSPTPSTSSSSSSDSYSSQEGFISIHDIFRRPAVSIESPEILLSYFDKNTCGIMSVKDGPTENPWRTLIWPLARDSQALYHAISSMTAFHMCRGQPQLRVEGIEHMRKSIRFLAQGLSHGNIGDDAALGTTLVLAFSEAFDRHISTGIEHLRGARVLLNQSLIKVSNVGAGGLSFRRLQFLFNVWVYLDVLARLTADASGDGGINPEMSYTPLLDSREVDPLLGCAANLFPLIGEAACLVQRVRKSEKTSVGIVAAAMNLKVRLESWQPEEYYEPIEDPSSEVVHCVTTAEAYRYATLLYLHQAVPGLLSLSAHDLADRVMKLIATIPGRSRCCVVHIYPMLVAGCEAEGEEERNWVTERWESMSNRMWIGNVDKSWQVVKEVWDRRDTFRARQASLRMSPVLTSVSSPNSRYGSPPFVSSPQGEFGSQQKRKYFNHNDIEPVLPWDPVSENGLFNAKRWALLDTNTGYPQAGNRGSVSDILHERRKGDYEYEVSIKGRLHWLGVMKEWGWEVLLG